MGHPGRLSRSGQRAQEEHRQDRAKRKEDNGSREQRLYQRPVTRHHERGHGQKPGRRRDPPDDQQIDETGRRIHDGSSRMRMRCTMF
jgi:hypothetical protein